MTKVLIVDDNPDFREVLRFELKYNKYDCMTAGTIEEGLMLMEVFGPDLILLDLGFQGYHGIDFLHCAKSFYKKAGKPFPPIIVISGETDPEVIRHVKEEGAVSFITKMDHTHEIMNQIRKYTSDNRLEPASV